MGNIEFTIILRQILTNIMATLLRILFLTITYAGHILNNEDRERSTIFSRLAIRSGSYVLDLRNSLVYRQYSTYWAMCQQVSTIKRNTYEVIIPVYYTTRFCLRLRLRICRFWSCVFQLICFFLFVNRLK